MSIITATYGAKPLYINELVNLAPGHTLSESGFHSTVTVAFSPPEYTEEANINDPVRILIVQRGLASNPTLLYPSPIEQSDRIRAKGINSRCNVVSRAAVEQGGARYGFRQQEDDEQNRLILEGSDRTMDAYIPKDVEIATTGLRISSPTIDNSFWPYTVIDVQINELVDQLSCVRVSYEVELEQYRKRGCGAEPEREIPLFRIPYHIFSPERIHEELRDREIHRAIADEYGPFNDISADDCLKITTAIIKDLESIYYVSREQAQTAPEELILYADSDDANLELSDKKENVDLQGFSTRFGRNELSGYVIHKVEKRDDPREGYSFDVNAQLSGRRAREQMASVFDDRLEKKLPSLGAAVAEGLKPQMQALNKNLIGIRQELSDMNRAAGS